MLKIGLAEFQTYQCTSLTTIAEKNPHASLSRAACVFFNTTTCFYSKSLKGVTHIEHTNVHIIANAHFVEKQPGQEEERGEKWTA